MIFKVSCTTYIYFDLIRNSSNFRMVKRNILTKTWDWFKFHFIENDNLAWEHFSEVWPTPPCIIRPAVSVGLCVHILTLTYTDNSHYPAVQGAVWHGLLSGSGESLGRNFPSLLFSFCSSWFSRCVSSGAWTLFYNKNSWSRNVTIPKDWWAIKLKL